MTTFDSTALPPPALSGLSAAIPAEQEKNIQAPGDVDQKTVGRGQQDSVAENFNDLDTIKSERQDSQYDEFGSGEFSLQTGRDEDNGSLALSDVVDSCTFGDNTVHTNIGAIPDQADAAFTDVRDKNQRKDSAYFRPEGLGALTMKKNRASVNDNGQGYSIGSAMDQNEDWRASPNNTISGNDRMHHLAMAAVAGTTLLRSPSMAAPKTLSAIRPGSKAECERRCGSDGFCDPSSELGCGGEYCGKPSFEV